jgi:hypothetical protein
MYNNIKRVLAYCFLIFLISCHSSTPNAVQDNSSGNPGNPAVKSEYDEFASKFKAAKLPYNLPGDAQEGNSPELDKKYVKNFLSSKFSPALSEDLDGLPGITDNMESAKYYACAKLKLDSFDGYIVFKQNEDAYYFLCIFDRKGNFTDGTWISFTEGSESDGTVREAAINNDGSLEIIVSQYNVTNGKPEKNAAEHHFFEVTSTGKIRDMKENTNPAHT